MNEANPLTLEALNGMETISWMYGYLYIHITIFRLYLSNSLAALFSLAVY